jgi:ADP-ribose pyrophosphatase YjhB (NUDIX family)
MENKTGFVSKNRKKTDNESDTKHRVCFFGKRMVHRPSKTQRVSSITEQSSCDIQTSLSDKIILQVGVKILLKNKEGKYLLLRRSILKYPEVKSRWDIVGGRINAGVTLMENLKREIFEETNLKLSGVPKLIYAQDILRKVGHHVVRLTYIGEAKGKIKLDESENDMYEWFSLKELKKLKDIDIYLKELLENNLI